MKGAVGNIYDQIRSGHSGYYEHSRGLIAVWGEESVRFLDGLISNDVKTLEDGVQMLAALPNAQGRLLAVVRVLRQGDRFLIETEEACREKVFKHLFRFTFAGDFFVEDISNEYRFIELFASHLAPPSISGVSIEEPKSYEEFCFHFAGRGSTEIMVIERYAGPIREDLLKIPDDLYETLRIESGIPRYGVDMDETTIVPELGLEGLISYTKGCYIGQEIIARIHFRGHIAKKLTGLIKSTPSALLTGEFGNSELNTPDGKNAGRITSVAFSPKLDATIALAFVRYDYLAEGTQLRAEDINFFVKELPFVV